MSPGEKDVFIEVVEVRTQGLCDGGQVSAACYDFGDDLVVGVIVWRHGRLFLPPCFVSTGLLGAVGMDECVEGSKGGKDASEERQ